MPSHSNAPRPRKLSLCASATPAPQLGVSALVEPALDIDRWMCDALRVGPRVSSAWARHLRMPRWRFLARPTPSLSGAMILFCGDDLHPFDRDKPGFAHLSYGYPREVIVLAVRRADRALLELVPDGEGEFEQTLCQAARSAPEDVVAALLAARQWRLMDSFRGFLWSWFAHGFGITAIQHAHMFHVMLQRTPEHRLPARREALEQGLNRREVRLIRRARRQLCSLLDSELISAVRSTGAILTPLTYNLLATASGNTRAQRQRALAEFPGLLPALLGRDPPLPESGAAEVLDYYRDGSDTRFAQQAQALIDMIDQGKSLAPRIAGWLDQPRAAIDAARRAPPTVFWRLDEHGVRALLRTLNAVRSEGHPRRLSQWMALRHVCAAVTELVEAFERRDEALGQLVWDGAITKFLTWAAARGWNDAVTTVWDEGELSYLTFGVERALTAEQDVAKALGIPVDSVLEELAKLTLPQLLVWNQRWQRALEDYRRRVELRSPVAGE